MSFTDSSWNIWNGNVEGIDGLTLYSEDGGAWTSYGTGRGWPALEAVTEHKF